MKNLKRTVAEMINDRIDERLETYVNQQVDDAVDDYFSQNKEWLDEFADKRMKAAIERIIRERVEEMILDAASYEAFTKLNEEIKKREE